MDAQTNLNEVRSTLLRVADRLSSLQRQTPQSPSTINTAAATATSSRIVSVSPASSSLNLPNTANQLSISGEQRRLFGYGWHQNNKGKSKSKGNKIPSCTIKFVCLASRNADGPPSTVKEKTFLANLGLGDGSISFLSNATVYDGIVQKFPKLTEAGGFDLFLYQRGGGDDKGFHIIHAPHIASRLKEVCGQAKIYIKPVQQDIALNNEDPDKIAVDEVKDDIPLVDCFICGAFVQMNKMSQHQDTHSSLPAKKKQKTLDDIIESCDTSSAITSSASTSSASKSSASTSSASKSSASTSSAMLILQELCPDASNTAIQGALVTANGNANAAAQQLLDPITVILDDEQELDDSDEELPTYTHTVDLEGLADVSTPASALRHFQQDIIEEGGPSQRFTVCRLDGLCDLRKDIMGIYKNPNTNLRVKPKVRFEEEDGVGSGPIREFLSNVIKVVDDGIPSGNKPLIFLEGEKDHRLPIHDQSLRLIGTFKAIGRMIGHSILHGGPGLTGLSPAAIHYLTTEREGQQPPPLAIEDIADIELRQLITELDALQNEEPPSSALKEGIVPYLLEAGLDPDHLNSNAKLIVDGLMLFNVIEKRRLELEDVAKGMEEVSLHSYMIKWPSLVKIVFPTEASRVIQGEDVKKCIVFEEKDSSAENQRTADFFVAYVGELELRKKDGAEMIDLISFWTGGTTIPSNHASMRIKFDGGANEMPLSETCFRNIILPTRHATYGIFRAKMDTALKYGSKGFSFN